MAEPLLPLLLSAISHTLQQPDEDSHLLSSYQHQVENDMGVRKQ